MQRPYFRRKADQNH